MPSIPGTYGTIKPPLGARLNLSNPLSRGLIGVWPLNEGTGRKAADGSLTNSQGLLNPLTFWSATPYGPGLNCANLPTNRSAAYINLPLDAGTSPLLNPTAQVTARVLCYYTINVENKLISREDGSGNGPYTISNQGAGGSLAFSVQKAGAVVRAGSGGSPSVNAWHDIVGTYDGANLRLYVDGVLWGVTALTGALASVSTNTVVGNGSYYAAYPFQGILAAAWLYNRALSAAEVSYLYTNPFAMVAPPLALTLQMLGAGGGVAPVAGSSSLVAAAALVSSGTASPVAIAAATGVFSPGGSLSVSGGVSPIAIPGSATSRGGLSLSQSGTASPSSISSAHALSSGLALVATGVASPVVVSGSATFVSGASLQGTGSGAPAPLSGTSGFSSGVAMSSVGAISPASISGSAPAFRAGVSLSHTGATSASAVLSATMSFASGLALSYSFAIGTNIFGSAPFSTGGALQVVGSLAAMGGASFAPGGALSVAATVAPATASGSPAFAAGGALQMSGVSSPAGTFGVHPFGQGASLGTSGNVGNSVTGSALFRSGAALQSTGATNPAQTSGSSSFQSGSVLSVLGTATPAIVVGLSNIQVGASFQVVGFPSPAGVLGTAPFATGFALSSGGVATPFVAPTFFSVGGSLQSSGTLVFTRNYVVTRTGSVMAVWYGSTKVSISGSM